MKPSSLALWLAATLLAQPLCAAELLFVDAAPLTTTPQQWLEQRLGVTLAPDYDRTSLLGHHHSFHQLVNGLPVATTQAAISIDPAGKPWRLYHNLRPLTASQPGCDASGNLEPLLTSQRANTRPRPVPADLSRRPRRAGWSAGAPSCRWHRNPAGWR